jgi:hypothetical protein
MPLERLQKVLDLEGKANLLLLRDRMGAGHAALLERVTRHCTLADYGLTVKEVPLAKAVEVRTARIFFDRRVAAAIQQRFPAAQPVITYMANTIAANGKATPYSMVTAVDAAAAPFLPEKSEGVVLNTWLADDLGAKAGDEVRIDYYALAGENRLVERSARLPVAGVVDLSGLAADRLWMPDFPGVATAEHAADWDAGVPIDMKRIRDKDEAYWDAHRGTPKLFLPLEKGRELFGNRWGEFTALRVPVAVASPADVTAGLLDAMTPAVAGLVLRDVGMQGMAAAASPVDFAGLLLGMSLFLMVAAVALTAMMFRVAMALDGRVLRGGGGQCRGCAAGGGLHALVVGISGNHLERCGRRTHVPVPCGARDLANRYGGVCVADDGGHLECDAQTGAAQRESAFGNGHRRGGPDARATGAVVGGGVCADRRRRTGRCGYVRSAGGVFSRRFGVFAGRSGSVSVGVAAPGSGSDRRAITAAPGVVELRAAGNAQPGGGGNPGQRSVSGRLGGGVPQARWQRVEGAQQRRGRLRLVGGNHPRGEPWHQ